jgi:hypothetical protein
LKKPGLCARILSLTYKRRNSHLNAGHSAL